jgi:hypothetical protein
VRKEEEEKVIMLCEVFLDFPRDFFFSFVACVQALLNARITTSSILLSSLSVCMCVQVLIQVFQIKYLLDLCLVVVAVVVQYFLRVV